MAGEYETYVGIARKLQLAKGTTKEGGIGGARARSASEPGPIRIKDLRPLPLRRNNVDCEAQTMSVAQIDEAHAGSQKGNAKDGQKQDKRSLHRSNSCPLFILRKQC
jgi:hypothetical protein